MGRLVFIKDPKLKVGHALSLIYPAEWLSEKPKEEIHAHFETNRDLFIDSYLARLERSRPQTLTGNIGQTAACLTHYVSDARLLKIKEAHIPVLVMTGTWDNLVNPNNSFHLSKVLGCPIEIFDGSGHGLPGEQPVRYNKSMDDHFSAVTK